MDGGRAQEAEAPPVSRVAILTRRVACSSYALPMACPVELALLVAYVCEFPTAGAAGCPDFHSGASRYQYVNASLCDAERAGPLGHSGAKARGWGKVVVSVG